MIKIRLFILGFAISLIVSCSSLTRVETDKYTITEIDTTRTYHVQNAPGNRDNGVIFPSSRVMTEERDLTQRDSTVERQYPNFIRAGLFESIGIFGGSSDYGLGTGLFGVMPDFGKLSNAYRGESGYLQTGGIYRLGIFEWRLRWFDDSPSWTYGTNVMEFLLPDGRGEKMLFSVLPFYVRKRIFLREEIPYITITPAAGIGLFPSQYLNLSTSLDIGSIGGLNLRTYIGLAVGYNGPNTPQIKNNDFSNECQSSVFPYFGIGMSVLDFLNVDKDMEIEWKNHPHSSWDVGLLQFAFLYSNADKSVFGGPDSLNSVLKGFHIKFANASVALPILDWNVYAGTSLFSIFAAGYHEYAISVLPIRIGYWHNLIPKELNLEPFLELGYYPMYSVNLGARIHARLNEIFNVSLNAGYISGSQDTNLGSDIIKELGTSVNFSKFYLGIGINLYDRIFNQDELRYFK